MNVTLNYLAATVAIAGFLTNCCVESTMRTAYEKGFDVYTLTDCTATVSEDEQRMKAKPMAYSRTSRERIGSPK